jgi:glycerophosphoryl diester phosphodiesterase
VNSHRLIHSSLRVSAILLLAQTVLPAFAEESAKPRIIAHRGGVVDAERIENSLPALQTAIGRGYWMVEADIRESKDGHPVVQHNGTFALYYNDSRNVADMTLDQIRELRSKPGDLRPLNFREYAAACKGKIRIMLDMKEPNHPKTYYEEIEATLRTNDLLNDALIIGIQEAKQYFKSKARVSVSIPELRTAIANGEDVSTLYFLFEHAAALDEPALGVARKANVPVVVSINTFHYPTSMQMQRAEEDIRRLRMLGVQYFQIDSVYDRWLLE